MTIIALLTCHNRRETTLRCLEQLQMLDLAEGFQFKLVVVDDGSTDGTGAALKSRFPDATVLTGCGSLFWCGGMRKAWARAAEDDPDYYLLANDDTMLFPEALMELLKLAPDSGREVIAVGAIKDAETGAAAYGGRRGPNGSELVAASGKPEECATFNANVVLVPRAVFRKIGGLYHAFTHGMGDFDYGFEAGRRGVRVVQTPGYVGTCRHNTVVNTWRDRGLTRRERLKRLHHPKAHPLREMVVYHRRNSGWLWPWRCVTPYLRILLGK